MDTTTALAVLTDALDRCGDEDMRTPDVLAALGFSPHVQPSNGNSRYGRSNCRAHNGQTKGCRPSFMRFNDRRHMTKGQRAMAVAKLYPDPDEVGRGKKGKFNLPFSKMTLSQARTVLTLDR